MTISPQGAPWELPVHGGGLAAAEARFGRPEGGWLDLSTGINPRPYPVEGLNLRDWTRLPDEDVSSALLRAAASAYGAPDAGTLVAAPGTQALIQWLPRLRPRGRVVVVGPTYGEHGAAWAGAGHMVREADSPITDAGTDVLVLCSPNNPDGRTYAARDLLTWAEGLAARGGMLVVDEAFADAVPDHSLMPFGPRPGLVVLRSFGKFFGLAGVRLGFAQAEAGVIEALSRALGPWAVSGPAIALGRRALADSAWIEATRAELKDSARALDAVLVRAGTCVLGGTPLFRLVRVPDAWALYRRLAARGILTRAFPYRRDWLRVGLPADDGELKRFEQGLLDSIRETH